MKRTSLIISLTTLIALFLIGCSEGDLGTTVDAANMPSTEDQIAKIEKNEHMPPAAKEAAISAIKSRAEASKAQAEAAKNAAAAKK